MMASENVILSAPSSGGPDARNDNDEADEGFAVRDEGRGSDEHVIGITPV